LNVVMWLLRRILLLSLESSRSLPRAPDSALNVLPILQQRALILLLCSLVLLLNLLILIILLYHHDMVDLMLVLLHISFEVLGPCHLLGLLELILLLV